MKILVPQLQYKPLSVNSILFGVKLMGKYCDRNHGRKDWLCEREDDWVVRRLAAVDRSNSLKKWGGVVSSG